MPWFAGPAVTVARLDTSTRRGDQGNRRNLRPRISDFPMCHRLVDDEFIRAPAITVLKF
jgi:hypothetical protein